MHTHTHQTTSHHTRQRKKRTARLLLAPVLVPLPELVGLALQLVRVRLGQRDGAALRDLALRGGCTCGCRGLNGIVLVFNWDICRIGAIKHAPMLPTPRAGPGQSIACRHPIYNHLLRPNPSQFHKPHAALPRCVRPAPAAASVLTWMAGCGMWRSSASRARFHSTASTPGRLGISGMAIVVAAMDQIDRS